MPYDGKFTMAEVNSDLMFWQKDDEKNEWKVVHINRTHIGTLNFAMFDCLLHQIYRLFRRTRRKIEVPSFL